MSSVRNILCVVAALVTAAIAHDDILASVASVAEKAVANVKTDAVAHVSNEVVAAALHGAVAEANAQLPVAKIEEAAAANASANASAVNTTRATLAASQGNAAQSLAALVNATAAADVVANTTLPAESVTTPTTDGALRSNVSAAATANSAAAAVKASNTDALAATKSSPGQAIADAPTVTNRLNRGVSSSQGIVVPVVIALGVAVMAFKKYTGTDLSASPYMKALNAMRQEESGAARNVELGSVSIYNQFP